MDDRRKTAGRVLSAFAALFITCAAAAAPGADTPPADGNAPLAAGESLASLAARCAPNVALGTLAAIVRHESAVNPYAIGINRSTQQLTRQPQNADEAIATASELMRQGVNFDIGLGQVNSGNLRRLGIGFADVVEPCGNLKAAGKILTDCYTRASAVKGPGQAALLAALSCYNSNSLTAGFASGYVSKVVAQATGSEHVPEIVPLKNGESLPIPLELRSVAKAKAVPTVAEAKPEAPRPSSPHDEAEPDNELDIFSQPDTKEEDASENDATTPSKPMTAQATAAGD